MLHVNNNSARNHVCFIAYKVAPKLRQWHQSLTKMLYAQSVHKNVFSQNRQKNVSLERKTIFLFKGNKKQCVKAGLRKRRVVLTFKMAVSSIAIFES